MKARVTSLAALLILSACGGGGSDSSDGPTVRMSASSEPIKITGENAVAATRNILAANYMLMMSGAYMAPDIPYEETARWLPTKLHQEDSIFLTQIARIADKAKDKHLRQRVEIASTQTIKEQCNEGGSYTLKSTDHGNDSYTATMSFNECRFYLVEHNGSFTATAHNLYEGSENVDLKITFNQLSAIDATGEPEYEQYHNIIHGDWRLQGDFSTTYLGFGHAKITINSLTIAYSPEDIIQLNNVESELDIDDGNQSVTINNGNLRSEELGGSLTLKTVSPLANPEYPNKGGIESRGAANSLLTINVQGAENVQLSVDYEGDGNIDWSESRVMEELMPDTLPE